VSVPAAADGAALDEYHKQMQAALERARDASEAALGQPPSA
jgi:hypothetical protein